MGRAYVKQDIRQLNRKYVFEIIRKDREVTRSEVSRITGISAPTMLKIFDYFSSIGVISEEGEQDAPIGRKANLFAFRPDSFYAIGVDYSGTDFTVGLVDLDRKIIKAKTYKQNTSFINTFDQQLAETISEFILQSQVPKERILGIGIGCPAAIDKNNVVLFAPLMDVMTPTDISENIADLEKKIGLPVYLENDTNAAAKGEFILRKLPDDESMVFVSLKQGLGAGYIVNGKIWHGSKSVAGEIGYLTFSEECKTDISRPGWMEERFIEAVQGTGARAEKNLAQICQNASIEEKKEITDRVSGLVSLIITNVAVVLDVDRFVLGGDVTKALKDTLFPAVKKKIEQISAFPISMYEESEDDPVIVGMAELVFERKMEKILG